MIEERLGVQTRHFSYPYGVTAACGDREFELAGRSGYVTAVTTRRGVLTPQNADALMSLPRVSINGNFEHPLMLEGLISGLPLFLSSLARRAIGRRLIPLTQVASKLGATGVAMAAKDGREARPLAPLRRGDDRLRGIRGNETREAST